MVDELMNDGAAMLIRDITLKGVGKFMEELRKLRDADDLYCPDAESSGRIYGLKVQESCAFPSASGFRRGRGFGMRDG